MIKKYLARKSVFYPICMLTLMWLGFALQLSGIITSCDGALIPFTPEGLDGIFFSPLLHGSWEHLLSNSVPIGVLIFLLFEFYPQIASKVLFRGWIFTGAMVWLMPPSVFFEGRLTCIIGASGIVYMLAFFLFFSGVFRWNMKLLTISLLVVLYYGSLIWGMLPEEFFSQLQKPSTISWQAHLGGAVVGTVMAFVYKKEGEKKKKFIWEFPNYYSEKDDVIWQEYIQKNPQDFEELPQKKQDNVWDYLEEIRKRS